jgi:hypothetical protein
VQDVESPPFNFHLCFKTNDDDNYKFEIDKKVITSNLVLDSQFTQTSTGFYK